jgi:hypothetical protein
MDDLGIDDLGVDDLRCTETSSLIRFGRPLFINIGLKIPGPGREARQMD